MSNKYPQINIGSLCPLKTRAELWKGATVVWDNSSITTPCAIAETYDQVSLKDIRNWFASVTVSPQFEKGYITLS